MPISLNPFKKTKATYAVITHAQLLQAAGLDKNGKLLKVTMTNSTVVIDAEIKNK